MKRVLCLYRVSTKKQLDPSSDKTKADIPLQRKACKEFIDAHQDWVLCKEMYERGVSGYKVSADKRDAIVDIRAEALKKSFDVLLVFLSDRLGRREDETPFVVEWFVRNGIEVWSVNEGQLKAESHEEKLLNYIRFWQANGESLKTSIRVSERHKQMVEDGIWRGGVCPYGYRLVFKGRIGKKNRQLLDLEVDPEKSAIVQEIFRLLCLCGYGTYRIANHLNAKYSDPEKIWTPRTIIAMLRNPIYTGRMRFKDTITSTPIEELRIVSDEMFEFAERILKEHIPKKYALTKRGEFKEVSRSADAPLPAKTKTQVYGASLLSGLLYCAHCDHRLVGTYHTKINARGERVYRPVYRCYNGAVQAKNCSGQRTYSAARIENAVLATVRQYFSTFSETIDEVWKEQAKAQLQRKRGLDIRNAQAKLTKLQQRQNKLKEEAIKALTGESVYAPEMIQELLASNTEAMNKAEAELQNAEKDRAELDAKLKELVRQYESIHDWAEVFDAAGVDEKKMILSHIIGKITVNRNYDITIYFFLTLDDFKHALAEEGRDNVKVCEEPVRKRRFA